MKEKLKTLKDLKTIITYGAIDKGCAVYNVLKEHPERVHKIDEYVKTEDLRRKAIEWIKAFIELPEEVIPYGLRAKGGYITFDPIVAWIKRFFNIDDGDLK